jgi:hypothetical protein
VIIITSWALDSIFHKHFFHSGWRSGSGAALLVGRSWDCFPVVSLDFSVIYSCWPYHGPGANAAPSENEYQEHFLVVKVAGAWDWQPHHLHVSNVMEIWEPKPPGTLWATPGLLQDSFTFYLLFLSFIVYLHTLIIGMSYCLNCL